MSLFNVFDISGSAMSAQSLRLNVTASNLANAESVASDPQSAYRSRHPVFETFADRMHAEGAGVRVLDVIESQAPVNKLYQPEHPKADDNGFVYTSNVNAIEEMVNMLSASRSYQNNIEVMNTSKELLMRTLSLGQ